MYDSGTKVFGTFRAPAGYLADVGKVAELVKGLADAIDMRVLGTHVYDVPVCVRRLGEEPLCDEGGVTAVAVVSTSHIAVHTWPEEGAARIDVDSCREFDPEKVELMLKVHMCATDMRLSAASLVLRGE